MASEEERAAILAEYKASVATAGGLDDEDEFEDDDEADFDPNNDDDDDSSNDDGDSDDDGEEEQPKDHVVLNGTMHLNEEGRLIYSGTWAMKSVLDKEKQEQEASAKNGSLEGTKPKKHPKFKLKSQDAFYPPSTTDNGNGNTGDGASKKNDGNNEKSKSSRRGPVTLFDLHRPTLSKQSDGGKDTNEEELPTRRTMIFDGFFFEPLPEESSPPQKDDNGKHHHHHHHHHGKKIKERDVELFIIRDTSSTTTEKYTISGRGYNEYGPFVVEGTYTVVDNGSNNNKANVICNKTYGVGGTSKTTRSGGAASAKAKGGGSKRSTSHRYANEDDDDSFDDDFDEKADYGEVNELFEDATLSVEELRRKYYGGGGGGDNNDNDDDGGGKMAAKRARLVESDDDECGF